MYSSKRSWNVWVSDVNSTAFLHERHMLPNTSLLQLKDGP
jgi:hypothetical protein